ncbi:uncharacterized protein [Cicer arietinum]|uniref:Uncharacterized protein LOC101506464 n=1 Tax=Cicer arietinum TaxID=3827 RepID=A0A1S2YQM0_CICAR|nr:uncharacterized protein LOC101506464 [Cicer arietinum]
MLPGVECARKRRLHQSRGSCDSTTTPSLGLYTRNLQPKASSPSLMERSVLKVKSFSDEELGGSAREAKRRLDEKFTASKPEKNKSYLWFIAQLKP